MDDESHRRLGDLARGARVVEEVDFAEADALSAQCLISKSASCEQRNGIGISVGAVGIRQF